MNSAVSMFQLWVGALINFPADAEDGSISENQDTGAVQRILGRNSDPIDALATARLVPSRHTTLEDLAISRPKIRHDTGRNIATLRSARQKTVTPISVRFSTPLNRRFQKFPWSKEKMNVSLQELIRQTLIEPLTPSDIDQFEFIYIFWHPGRFGYVKIYYSRNVDQRLQSGNDNAGTPSSSTSPEKPAWGRGFFTYTKSNYWFAPRWKNIEFRDPPARIVGNPIRMVSSQAGLCIESGGKVDEQIPLLGLAFENQSHSSGYREAVRTDCGWSIHQATKVNAACEGLQRA
jgi:hypothetical protein